MVTFKIILYYKYTKETSPLVIWRIFTVFNILDDSYSNNENVCYFPIFSLFFFSGFCQHMLENRYHFVFWIFYLKYLALMILIHLSTEFYFIFVNKQKFTSKIKFKNQSGNIYNIKHKPDVEACFSRLNIYWVGIKRLSSSFIQVEFCLNGF